MDERDDNESTDEEYTYRITLHSMRDKVQPLNVVVIGDEKVKCLIDSGAGVNVTDSCLFNPLENVCLLPTSKKSYGYRSTESLPVVGKFEADVKSKVTGKFKATQFCIIDGNLIGCQKATDLGLLCIVNSVSTPIVDNSVKPLAQKYHRLPFHICDQVKAEVKNIEELQIIKKAEGPTPWVSPIVVAQRRHVYEYV